MVIAVVITIMMVLIFMILKICYSVKTLVNVERLNSPLYEVEDFFGGIGIRYGNNHYIIMSKFYRRNDKTFGTKL